MRESSHSFPGLNRACVVISSQLYDRRAIDSPLPTLPLLTSLQHLAYLTSTSPRIREILTLDGGLERLISIVGGCLDLAISPSPAASSAPAATSARAAPAPARRRKRAPFKPFSAYRDVICALIKEADGELSQENRTLLKRGNDWIDLPAVLHTYGYALQCLVNVGVRGSEQIRTRVVEAGVLGVVARILGGFLKNRQVERERRLALLEPQKSITLWQEGATSEVSRSHAPHASRERTTSQDGDDEEGEGSIVITASTPTARSTQAHTHTTPQRQASHSAFDPNAQITTSYAELLLSGGSRRAAAQQQEAIPSQPATLPPSASRLPLPLSINRTNTPDTIASVDDQEEEEVCSSGQENENEQMDTEEETASATSSGSRAASRSNSTTRRSQRQRRGTVKAAPGAAVSDIVASAVIAQRSGDESMQTPPPAPTPTATAGRDEDGDTIMGAQASSRDSVTPLADADATPVSANLPLQGTDHAAVAPSFAHPSILMPQPVSAPTPSIPSTNVAAGASSSASASLSAALQALGSPSDHLLKDDDVLHCLHLLAYLSKYPHVRAVFHDPENETCRPPPPSSPLHGASSSVGSACPSGSACTRSDEGECNACPRKRQRCGENGERCAGGACAAAATTSSRAAHSDENDRGEGSSSGARHAHGHAHTHAHTHTHAHEVFHAHAHGSDNEDEVDDFETAALARARAMAAIPLKDRQPAAEPIRPPRSTANNVFSLVEQFTFRPSGAADRAMRLPTDIQYWAGVIMRNACRKDENRGGIRQCANMGCGVWEKFPREFAKCRRCRKAKYCSKGCQRRAWQAGHRYWCSARNDTPPQQPHATEGASQAADNVAVQIANAAAHPHEHEHAHGRHHHHHHALALGVDDIALDGAEPVGQVGGPGIGLAVPANDVRVIGGEL